MSDLTDYEQLLNEDDLASVRERREAIGRAMDDVLEQMEQIRTERRSLDAKEEQFLALGRKLDDAHARLARGLRYTEKIDKRLVRHSWADETHEWVERYLLHFARKELQEGPKEVGALYANQPGTFAMADVVKLMEERPDEFQHAKGPKPQRKYARASYVWSLRSNPRRYSPPTFPTYWNVEAVFMAEGQKQRNRTFSEAMHEMLEQAIQSFYARQSSSVFTAFAELYFRDFGRAYQSLKQAYEVMVIRAEMTQKAEAEQQSQPALNAAGTTTEEPKAPFKNG